MWLLRIQGSTLAAIGAAFEISGVRVTQLLHRFDAEIAAAHRREVTRPTMAATQRLQRLGALPRDLSPVELPPADWPRSSG